MGLFSKKKHDGDEDSNRGALFGRSKKEKDAPAPASSNPYAQSNVPPDPYTQAKMNAGILPSQQGQKQAVEGSTLLGAGPVGEREQVKGAPRPDVESKPVRGPR